MRRSRRRRWLKWVVLVLVADAAIFWWWRSSQVERRFDGYIHEAAGQFGVEAALIKAVIWQESRFKPDAIGGAGEIGLMQLMELAAFEWADAQRIRNFKHAHAFDPVTNILAGTFFLKQRLERYKHTDNPMPYALADYNAGRTHVVRWAAGEALTNSVVFLQNIDYPATRSYIDSVTMRHGYYR